MNQSVILLLSIACVVYVLYNQVRIRKVAGDSKLTLPLIMFVIGAVFFKQYLESGQVTMLSWISIGISFTVLAIGMAAVRACTVRIWQSEGIVLPGYSGIGCLRLCANALPKPDRCLNAG